VLCVRGWTALWRGIQPNCRAPSPRLSRSTGPAILDFVVAVGDQPNIPHIELDLAKNHAIGKIKEAVIVATG